MSLKFLQCPINLAPFRVLPQPLREVGLPKKPFHVLSRDHTGVKCLFDTKIVQIIKSRMMDWWTLPIVTDLKWEESPV